MILDMPIYMLSTINRIQREGGCNQVTEIKIRVADNSVAVIDKYGRLRYEEYPYNPTVPGNQVEIAHDVHILRFVERYTVDKGDKGNPERGDVQGTQPPDGRNKAGCGNRKVRKVRKNGRVAKKAGAKSS